MNDTQYTCSKCGGFKGALVDFPTCPNCGAEAEYYWDAETTHDKYFKSKEEQDAYAKGVAQLLRMNDDDLRARIESSGIAADIHRDVNVMADVLREIVKNERQKHPKLRNHARSEPYDGIINLWEESENFFKGDAYVDGCKYEAVATKK